MHDTTYFTNIIFLVVDFYCHIGGNSLSKNRFSLRSFFYKTKSSSSYGDAMQLSNTHIVLIWGQGVVICKTNTENGTKFKANKTKILNILIIRKSSTNRMVSAWKSTRRVSFFYNVYNIVYLVYEIHQSKMGIAHNYKLYTQSMFYLCRVNIHRG